MRIAFIVDKSAPFFVGGYETRVLELAKRLARRHDVRVFTSLPREKDVNSGVVFVKCSPLTYLRESGTDRSLLHGMIYSASLSRSPFVEWKPDCVIVESIPYLHLPVMATWMGHLNVLKVLNVNEAWASYSYLPGVLSRPSRFIVKWCLSAGIRWADLAVGISEVTSTSLRLNYNARNVATIPMGIDTNLVRSAASAHAPVEFDFVTMARLVPIKRVTDLIEAVGLLKQRYRWDGKVGVIGDGPCRPELTTRVKALGLDSNVKFFGLVSGTEKYRILASAGAFVLTSEREGFSIATLEALACGLPCIVAKPPNPEVFGVSDIVIANRTGYHYPVGNLGALVERMHQVLLGGQEVATMREECRALAGRYDWNRVSAKLEGAIIERAHGVGTGV